MKDRDIQKKVKKGQATIATLGKRLEAAQSLALRTLLATEINAYGTLVQVYAEYAEAQLAYLDHLNDRFKENAELVKRIANPDPRLIRQQNSALAILTGIHASQQIQCDNFDNFTNWYLFVLGPDDRDWGKMFSALGITVAEQAIGAVVPPVITSALSLIAGLVGIPKKLGPQVPDYSKTDKQLADIENHIRAIEELTQHLQQYTEGLRESLRQG